MKKKPGILPAFLLPVLFTLLFFSVKAWADPGTGKAGTENVQLNFTNIIWSGSESGGELSVNGSEWKDGFDLETGEKLKYLEILPGETLFSDTSLVSHTGDYDMVITFEKSSSTAPDPQTLCLFTEGPSAGTFGCRKAVGEPVRLSIHLDVFQKGTDRRIKIPQIYYRIRDFSDSSEDCRFESNLLMQGADLDLELKGPEVYGIFVSSERYTAEYRAIYGSVEDSSEEVWAGLSPEGTAAVPDENFHFVKWVADRDILLDNGVVAAKGEPLTSELIRRTVMRGDVVFTAFHEKNPKVSYTSDPFGSITGIKSEYVAANTNPAGTSESPAEGYQTACWKADRPLTANDGTVNDRGCELSFEEMQQAVITEDVTFEAVHRRMPKVVYQTDGHGRIVGKSYEYMDYANGGNPAGSSEEAEKGWVFCGWKCDKDVVTKDGSRIPAGETLEMDKIRTIEVSEDMTFTAFYRPCPLLSLEKRTERDPEQGEKGLRLTVSVKELAEDTWAENVILCIQNPEGVTFDTDRVTASAGTVRIQNRQNQKGSDNDRKGEKHENGNDESSLKDTDENSGSQKSQNGEKAGETAEKKMTGETPETETVTGDQIITVTIDQLAFEDEEAVVIIPAFMDPDTYDGGYENGKNADLIYAVCRENPDEIVTGSSEIPVYRTIETGIVNGMITPSARQEDGSSCTVAYQPCPGFFVEKILLDGREQDKTSCQQEFVLKEVREDHKLEVICRKSPVLSIEVVSDKEIYSEQEPVVYTVRTSQTVEDAFATDVLIRMENPDGLVFDPESVILSKGEASVLEETDEQGILHQIIEVRTDRLEHKEDVILTFNAAVNEDLDDGRIISRASAVCCEDDQAKTDDTEVRVFCSVITSVLNGSVSESAERIVPGELFSGVYTPEEGFYLASVSVDGEEINLGEYGNEYVFENITSSHTLDVVCNPIVPLSENREGENLLYEFEPSRAAESVKTGDGSDLPFWYCIAISGAAGFFISVFIYKKKFGK